MKILKEEKKRKDSGTTARAVMDVDPDLVATELPSMYREKEERKWKPSGFYSFEKVPGTQQPLAPDDFDPTAPPIIKRKPITNGVRHVALISRAGLYKGRPLKQLTAPLKKKAGRCSITGVRSLTITLSSRPFFEDSFPLWGTDLRMTLPSAL